MIINRHNKNNKYVHLLVYLLIVTVIMTFFSDSAYASVSSSLKTCVSALIPSLFPFCVLSALISRTAVFVLRSRQHPCIWVIPFILGALCGFPVGASTVAFLYEQGSIPKKDAEYLTALCNNTGPAFIIGVIGAKFWRNTHIGVMFYFCQIFSSIFVYTICKFIFGNRRSIDQISFSKNMDGVSSNDFSFCTAFCDSVAGSAISVLQICGYVVFFKVICDIFRKLLSGFFFIKPFYALFASFMEFSSGAAEAAKLGGSLGIAICGFAIGFSGLSVMAQSAGFLYKVGLSALPLLRLKFYIGITTSLLSLFCYSKFDFSKAVFVELSEHYPQKCFYVFSAVIIVAFILTKIFVFMSNRFLKSHK